MQNDIECNLVVENLSAFFDKELNNEFALMIKKHLCNCLSCRREFSRLLKTQNLLKNYFNKSSFGNIDYDYEKILAQKNKKECENFKI